MTLLKINGQSQLKSFNSLLANVLLAASLVSLSGCTSPADPTSKHTSDVVSVEKADFGRTDGKAVYLYTLTNANGMQVSITNYGGIITSMLVPDEDGNVTDVVLGYDNLENYISDTNFFGALIGRYGNRIAQGKFTLEGEEYTLETNNGVNHLHGGSKGFHKQVWESESFSNNGNSGVKLTFTSEDGAGGYPGNLEASAVYELNNNNELSLRFTATTDKATPVNLTNHSYFNLAGSGSILNQELMINADSFLPVDDTLIPSGEVRPVADTPFDFTQSKPIGKDINTDNEQLAFGEGYDHNFVLNEKAGDTLSVAAKVTDPASGRVLEVLTDEPGIQFYSGNFLDGSTTGKKGQVYEYRTAIALEPQHFPDSPNQPDFPSTILQPGETYEANIVYRFSTAK